MAMGQSAENSIQIDERVKWLSLFPCFAAFTKKQSKELAKQMQEVTFHANEKIVEEGEVINNIYIIVKGESEVVKASPKQKKPPVPIAILRAGEAIGLNESGFYSETGQRTATVIALTNMLLLQLDVKVLHEFLKKYYQTSTMYTSAEQMLRMDLIKHSLPFSKLSHERLQWLANKVEEKMITAGTLLFEEGEKGDLCYLIREGEIEIFTKENNEEKRLAVLKNPALFGEATLITNTKRNASARALVDTILLMIDYQLLTELLSSEQKTTNMFMTLMVDRSRPIKNPHVTLHERLATDGQVITILKNTDTGRYFKLSPEGMFVWKKLNGKHTLQEITLEMADKFKVFAPHIVSGLITKLAEEQFIENVPIDGEIYFNNQSGWKKLFSFLSFDKKFILGDADKWVTRIYNKYIHYFFTMPAKILFTLISALGLISFIIETPKILLFFSIHHVSLLLVFGLLPLSALKVILHELGHAFAVKASGHEIHYLGVGIKRITPIAFADTSDMWLAKRKLRIFVNLAGIFMDALLAGICAILIFLIPHPYIQGMLWLFALYTYLIGFSHLNPTQDTDGYYVLMDTLEQNHLRQHAALWLIKKFPQALRQPKLFLQNKAEIIYWLICIGFLICVTVLTYIIQKFFLAIIGIQEINLYVALALPFLAALFSSIGIIIEVKNEAE
jgi:CRP-like cAMP-binding protein